MAAITAAALAAALTVSWTTANSVATGDQDTSAIAANRNGQVAVAWESDNDVYVRLWTNATAKYELRLATGGTHRTPDVGLDDKGNAVVVWAEDGDGNGVYNIQYRVVSPAGSVTASGRANADTAGDQILPRVAVDPDSATAFTVVWEDVQGSTYMVKAAGYTAPTTKAYEVFASQQTGQHHRPDVAVSASGDAVVVWDEDADANGYYNIGLVGLAKANGAVTLSRRTANSLGDGQQRRASVAETFNGEFAVAWESDHTGTAGAWTRTFASGGAPRGTEVLVANGGTAPSVGIDAQSNTVVAWTAGQDVWTRGFNPDGTSTDRLAAGTSSQTTTGKQEQIAVAVSHWGEVAVSYTDDNDGNGADQVILGTGGSNSTW